MKKSFFLVVIVCAAFASEVKAQSSTTLVTIETVTSIEPKDGKSLVFNSSTELEQFVTTRIPELKKLIVEFQNEPSKAGLYREELWRVENAKVENN